MTFEPQCKTRADLHREWARVLDMCEAAGFNRPWECVKIRGECKRCIPVLDASIDDYEFFLDFVEGKPVFRGSDLFSHDGTKFNVTGGSGSALEFYLNGRTHFIGVNLVSWNPPKPKTITINEAGGGEMTDRELLELAAKAARIKIYTWLPDGSPSTFVQRWNPLTDDGDALRLAVKIGMVIDVRYTQPGMFRYNDVMYWPSPAKGVRIELGDFETDPLAATRRAIVRAAAEIGKGI